MGIFGKKKQDNREITAPRKTIDVASIPTAQQLEAQIRDSQNYLYSLQNQIAELEQQVIIFQDEALYQSFGIYQPLYDLQNSEEYRVRLDAERENQKGMIRAGTAISGRKDWLVNNSKSEGKKMIADMQKLLLRAFNNECDEAIGKVRYSNMQQSIKRIRLSYESVSKLGRVMNLAISEDYYASKILELRIAFEYAQKKQEEKEAQRQLREQERENRAVQREIEEQRRKLEKEQAHYENALALLVQQMETASDEAKEEIRKKIEDANLTLQDISKAMDDVDYRAANQRAGYVYIISNIGSFGENVFKIGMTRRLDPTERVYELSDASVPFNFDIHAMIFSDDAPGLEAALHRAFENRKINMVNHRREFFYATPEEIKSVIRQNFTKAFEFVDAPEAEQYRVSLKMKEMITQS